MGKHLLVILSLAFSAGAMAEASNCSAAAAEKKLVGSAKTAFLAKCNTESKAMSTAVTKERKSMGDSKSGFGGCGHASAAANL